MGKNKVVFEDEVIMDITDSTVTPATLAEGATAYNAAGDKIDGALTVKKIANTIAEATAGGSSAVPSGNVIKEMLTPKKSRIVFTDTTYTKEGYVDYIVKNGFCAVTVAFKQNKTVRLGGTGRLMCVGLPPVMTPTIFMAYNTYTEDPPIRCSIETSTQGETTLKIVNVSSPSPHEDQFYRASFTYPVME